MPPRFKFTKEHIILQAISLIRDEGIDALTARNLANKLGSSSKVIFNLFDDMADLKNEVLKYLKELVSKSMVEALQSTDKPTYLSCGLVYVNFAIEEKELFKVLYLRERTEEEIALEESHLMVIYQEISTKSGLNIEIAKEIHDRYWVFMHGLAVSIVTGYRNVSKEQIETLLSDNYLSLVKLFKDKKG